MGPCSIVGRYAATGLDLHQSDFELEFLLEGLVQLCNVLLYRLSLFCPKLLPEKLDDWLLEELLSLLVARLVENPIKSSFHVLVILSIEHPGDHWNEDFALGQEMRIYDQKRGQLIPRDPGQLIWNTQFLAEEQTLPGIAQLAHLLVLALR